MFLTLLALLGWLGLLSRCVYLLYLLVLVRARFFGIYDLVGYAFEVGDEPSILCYGFVAFW